MSADPEQCQSMVEVRAGVDAVDDGLVALLGLRFGYMRAAARIKTSSEAIRDEARKQRVLANVRALAKKASVPEGLVARLWEELIEASITYEQAQFDARQH